MSYKKGKDKRKMSPQIHGGRNYGVILVFLCFCALISYFSLNKYQQQRAYGTLSLNEVVGYQTDGTNYSVEEGQDHYLSFAVEEKVARGFFLYFAQPIGVDTPVTANCYWEGNLVKTIQTVVPAADSSIAFLCGNRQVDTVTVSFDGNFSLTSAVSELLYEIEEDHNQALLKKILVILVILLIVSVWVAQWAKTEELIQKIVLAGQSLLDFFVNDWKKAAYFLGAIVCGVLCGNILWAVLAQLIPSRVWAFNRSNLVFGSMIGLVLFVVVWYLRSSKMKFETMYLCCGLIGSVALAALLPFHLNISWDDQTHYNNAVCLSHMGSRVSVSEYDYYQSCFYPMLKDYGNHNRPEMNQLLDDPDSNHAVTETDLGFLLGLNGLVYVPVAAMLFLCRGLGIPMHLCILLGRMMGACFFFFIMYLGMRHLKSGKMVMAAASLVPVCLYVTSNFNYDYWMLAMIGFSMAYLMGEYQRPDQVLTVKDMLLIYLPFLAGIVAKPVYIPLLALAAFLPKSKFKSEKFCRGYRLFFIGMVVCAAIGFMVLIFGGMLGNGDVRGGEEVNAPAQVQYILSNPVPFMNMLFGFLKEYLSPQKIVFNLADTAYIPVKTWLGVLTLIWLLCVCVVDREKTENQRIGWYVKAVVIPLAFITACAVSSAMYIMYTAVGAGTVAGCSGRYLLPTLFPLLLFLSRIRFGVLPQTEKTKRWTEGIVMGISMVPAMIMMTIFV